MSGRDCEVSHETPTEGHVSAGIPKLSRSLPPSGLERAEPEPAEEDRQEQGDPPGALSALWPLCPALRRLRADHGVASHPASVAAHHPVDLRAPAGLTEEGPREGPRTLMSE